METENCAPFIRWPGAKRKHARFLADATPSSFGTYFEPFLGGGALYFELKPKRAVLGDKISDLIRTYWAVRDGPRAVARYAQQWSVDSTTYYDVRGSVYSDRFERAGQFLYLNRTCWNGIYRVNSSGKFNVPYGRPKSSHIVHESHLVQCSRLLKTASIAPGDFEVRIDGVKRGDFVYLDPPYVTGHENNGFVDYNEELFSWQDQERLALIIEQLARKGVHVLLTNADHESVRDLYAGFNMTTLHRHSTLAGAKEHRRPVSELLVSSGRIPRS